MKRFVLTLVPLLILCSALVSLSKFNIARAESGTIIVPDDYPTIQEAVNNAVDGDSILVRAGIYYEHVVLNKTVSLLGVEGTTIDASGAPGGTLDPSIAAWNGITVLANNCTITRFHIRNATNFGIEIRADYGVFEENLVEYCNGAGIALYAGVHDNVTYHSSHDNLVLSNIVRYNLMGVSLNDAYNNTVNLNTIERNEGMGIYLFSGSRNNAITNNLVSYSSGTQYDEAGYGIAVGSSSHNNLITGNDIRNNVAEGIRIEIFGYGYLPPYDNLIHHNNLINNAIQAYDNGTNNIWDDGYPLGGNYWSDYAGVDTYSGPFQNETDSDGIGDTTYVIDVNNADNYPLMQPYYGPVRNLDTGQSSPTIQKGIDTASEGDRILVLSGIYIENVIVNKRLTIRSQSGAENTIVRTVDPMTQEAVFTVTADNVTISGFTVTVMVGWGGQGIHLDQVNYCNISDNVCYKNAQGIHLSHSDNNLIMNNNVSNNQGGIYLHDSHYNKILNNTASKNTYGVGITLVFSTNNEVLNNTANANQDVGIALMEAGTSNNLIANNTVNSNRVRGISLAAAENNRILNNIVMNNGAGIVLWAGSKNNVLYLNILINNYENARAGLTNIWNSTEKITYTYNSNVFTSYVGNYWSDYIGTDADNDGIGDTPYLINENNTDNCPLMTPWSLEYYELTVTSSPITGATFRIEGVPHTTPHTIVLPKGSYTLEMMETHTVGYARYYWSQWSDGVTGRSRTVDMNTNITLAANYTGPYYELTINSSPTTGIPFVINGTPQTTPYTEWLVEGSYTIMMPETHNRYVWFNWLEDGDTNRTKTVTMNKRIMLTAVFTLDATPPAISILSPENKTYVVTDVSLSFTVSESTSWIGYSLDERTNVTISGNTTLSGLSNGIHTITVYVNDTVGNTGYSDTIPFIIDNVPPNIEILSPENKAYVMPAVPLSFTVSEPTSWIGYSLDGQTNITITGNTVLAGLPDGTHSLVVYAGDTAGNMGSSVMVHFTIDTTLPNISILSPENKTYDTADIPLTFTVDEPTSWMAYSLNGLANVTITGDTTLTGLYDGRHSIVVHGIDMAGNTASSDTVYFAVDTTAPSILILSLENKTYDIADIPLDFTVDEPTLWIGYSLDGQANMTITGNTTLPELSEGQHSLLIHAKDVAGNTGTSETIYFTITKASEPFPIWIVATIIIITIAVVGVTILVYFRKIRKKAGKAEE